MSLTKTISALSDENRRKIIDLLKKKELSVTEMLEKLSITMPTLSHHLDVLKRADLISGRRDGQKIYYSINMSAMEELSEKIVKILATKNKNKK